MENKCCALHLVRESQCPFLNIGARWTPLLSGPVQNWEQRHVYLLPIQLAGKNPEIMNFTTVLMGGQIYAICIRPLGPHQIMVWLETLPGHNSEHESNLEHDMIAELLQKNTDRQSGNLAADPHIQGFSEALSQGYGHVFDTDVSRPFHLKIYT